MCLSNHIEKKLFLFFLSGERLRVHHHYREDRLRLLRPPRHQLRLQLRHLHAEGGQVQAGPGQEGGAAVQQGGEVEQQQLRFAKVQQGFLREIV